MTTCEPLPNGGSERPQPWCGIWPTPMTVNRTSRKAQRERPTSGPQRGGASYGLEDVVTALEAGLADPRESDDPQLTLFAEDSPASPSPSPGRASRRRIAGGSGQHSQASFATCDPPSCSWKTCRVSLDGEWETYSETWPPSGMTRNGTAFRRASSVPPIYATGSGLWPTPSANPFEQSPEVFL